MSAVRLRDTWRDAVRAVDRDPGEAWRPNLAHHSFRALVVLGIAVLIPVLLPREPLPEVVSLEEGMVATEDVIAQSDVLVRKPAEQLEVERAEAERSVLPIYVLDPSAADSAVGLVRAFFAGADTAFVAGTGGEVDSAAVEALLGRYGIQLGSGQAAYLADPAHRRALRRGLERAFSSLLPGGVASILDLSPAASGRVLVRGPDRDRIVPRDSLTTVSRFLQDALAYAPSDASIDGFQLYQNLLVRFTVPSLQADDLATMEARKQARASVDTIMGTILAGERIISAHERVGRRDIIRLRAYNAELARRGLASAGSRRRSNAGATLYGILLLSLIGGVLFLYRPRVYQSVKGFLIVMGLVTLVLATAGLIVGARYPPELIPVVLLGLLVGALYDGLLAIVAVAVAAGLLGAGPFAAGVGAKVPFLLFAAGSAGALAVRKVRRRSQSWVLIALIAGAYIVAGASLTLLQSLPVRSLLATAGWGTVAAVMYTVLAVAAFIPALERITGISTDQTLLELCDLNAPLLRELSRKAPGTYAHSINVANLAEAACTAIGANPLLVRAGVYYHDIGKMENPQYFVENQPKGRNPHDRLPPARSAAIIRDHVREGLRLATEHRLPPVIHDFICEHHGTTTISFFLDKARSEDPNAELDLNDYTYPGPKPQTKETAVVMLADGVESATRVLQDPTPDRIRGAIEQIVRLRIEESQLDQSPLTLRDLDRVKAEFARVLIGMYHRRIEYPSGVRAREELPVPGTRPHQASAGDDTAPEEPARGGTETSPPT